MHMTRSGAGGSAAMFIGALVLVLSCSTSAQVPSAFGTPVNATISIPSNTMETVDMPPAVGDFDNDGTLDQASVFTHLPSTGNSIVVCCRGTPGGGLQPPQLSPIGSYYLIVSTRMVPADVDGNGNLDLIVIHQSNLKVLFGNGNGTFGPLVSMGPGGMDFDGADVNGDGWMDCVVKATGLVMLYLGNGSGLSVAATAPALVNIPTVQLGDVDGDGTMDFVEIFPGGMTRVRSVSGSGFGPMINAFVRGDGRYCFGDANGDGRLDALATELDQITNTIDLVVSLGAATAPFSTTLRIPVTWPIWQAFCVDVDGDAIADILFNLAFFNSPYLPRRFGWLRGDGLGGFASSELITWGAPVSRNWPKMTAYDADADGDIDLAFREADFVPVTTPVWVPAGIIPNLSIRGRGAAGVGGVPLIAISSPVVGNAAFSIGLANAAPLAPAALGIAAAPRSPWNGLGFGLDLATLIDLPMASGGIALTTTDILGTASVGIPLPNLPSLSGTVAFAQWGVLDPQGTLNMGIGFASATRMRQIVIF